MKPKNKVLLKWNIAIKVLPVLGLIAILKTSSHLMGYEVLQLNALFTSLVAGTIFLIGFLISGVLSDYKESEKLPTELVCSLIALYDDIYLLVKCKQSDTAIQYIAFHRSFVNIIPDWFTKKEKTRSILAKISRMNDYIVDLEIEGVQANYIIKLKSEQSNIRKIIMRIDTIRDTTFISSAYAIVEFMGLLIALCMLVIEIQPFFAAVFFTLLISFLITYMVFLIKDLDNPFDYNSKVDTGTEVSLKALYDLVEMLNTRQNSVAAPLSQDY